MRKLTKKNGKVVLNRLDLTAKKINSAAAMEQAEEIEGHFSVIPCPFRISIAGPSEVIIAN